MCAVAMRTNSVSTDCILWVNMNTGEYCPSPTATTSPISNSAMVFTWPSRSCTVAEAGKHTAEFVVVFGAMLATVTPESGVPSGVGELMESPTSGFALGSGVTIPKVFGNRVLGVTVG